MTMDIRVFDASDGDCLLLSADDDDGNPVRILVDGGRGKSFRENTRGYLYAKPCTKEICKDDACDADYHGGLAKLDLVVVSHIDNDHISGILQLFKDKIRHKVRDHEIKKANEDKQAGTKRTKNRRDRPPQIDALWHCDLKTRLETDDLEGSEPTTKKTGKPPVPSTGLENASATGDLLATSSAFAANFFGELDDDAARARARLHNVATGFRSAMELELRVDNLLSGAKNTVKALALPEPLEAGSDAYRPVKRKLGPFELTVLGPTPARMAELAKEWKDWASENKKIRQQIVSKIREEEAEMGLVEPSTISAGALGLGASSHGISLPNLASLIILAKVDDSSILLTGDASAEDILTGLEMQQEIEATPIALPPDEDEPSDEDAGGDGDEAEGRPSTGWHVNVLKVQHHGALANVTEEFCRRVTADHYVFCGNGAHDNPEVEVLKRFANARREFGPADAPFTFWFTSSSATEGLSTSRAAHMTSVEDKVKELKDGTDKDGTKVSPGLGDRFTYTFLEGSSALIEVPTAKKASS